MEKIRIHFNFYGRVQGVGFRYRAAHGARLCGLTGWVRNNCDDSAELELQGDRASIRRALEILNDSPYICIDRMDKTELLPIPESSFEVLG